MRPLGVPKGVVVVGHLVELEVGGVGKDGGEEGGGGGGSCLLPVGNFKSPLDLTSSSAYD